MTYLAIVTVTNNLVAKFQPFVLEADASAHVAIYGGFVAPDPGGAMAFWVANVGNETLTLDQTAQDAAALLSAKKSTVQDINDLRDIKKSLPILSEGYTIESGDLQAGEMATELYFEDGTPVAFVSLTSAGGIATGTTDKNHHIKSGQSGTMAGAIETEYNVTDELTVTGKKTFTYPISGTPVSPATGSPEFIIDTLPRIPTTNETDVFIDRETYADIAKDLKKYVTDCQFRARGLKNLVQDATTVAEIDAIDIEAGWPDTGV